MTSPLNISNRNSSDDEYPWHINTGVFPDCYDQDDERVIYTCDNCEPHFNYSKPPPGNELDTRYVSQHYLQGDFEVDLWFICLPCMRKYWPKDYQKHILQADGTEKHLVGLKPPRPYCRKCQKLFRLYQVHLD